MQNAGHATEMSVINASQQILGSRLKTWIYLYNLRLIVSLECCVHKFICLNYLSISTNDLTFG